MTSLKVMSEGDWTLTASESPALYTSAEGGVFLWLLDLSALQAGDTALFRVRVKVRAAGVERIIKRLAVAGAQDPPHVEIGPFFSDQWLNIAGLQSAGTYRTVPWKLLRVGG